jgi:uncharacterized membrane protein YfcA
MMAYGLGVEYLISLALMVSVMAILYSSVGHGGASGYLAAMALMGLSVLDVKPAALVMNIAVASMVVYRFAGGGYFNWRLFAPFAVASVPLAYLGGSLDISAVMLKVLIGASLLVASLRLFMAQGDVVDPRPPGTAVAMIAGAAIGFVAGLTGVGGAIYLSPVLYAMRWADMRTNAAVSGAFVLVNSIAGLFGYLGSGAAIPSFTPILVVAALAGALLGTSLGLQRMNATGIRRLLGIVLTIAGGKLILTA